MYVLYIKNKIPRVRQLHFSGATKITHYHLEFEINIIHKNNRQMKSKKTASPINKPAAVSNIHQL